MNNLQLAIIKNKNFYNLVNELGFDCIFFEENNFFLKIKSNIKTFKFSRCFRYSY
jgi:hypothetical protein